ncbi:MAG: hemolysin III family protein [Alphaproteobacteria bacterium]|nr:hemolysin III family protein [Alphaproteobacteria bacterium]
MSATVLTRYSPKEELWSCLLHGFGIILGVAALSILAVFSSLYSDVWSIVSTAIFGVSMILLYTASTLYHAAKKDKWRKILKKFDHISIYYLIAGSYTPFMLVNLRGALGWSVFGIIWGLALLGTFLKLLSDGNGAKAWSVGLYLAMGWLVVFASKTLFAQLPTTGIVFLILGGLAYTFGVLFYINKKRAYTHAIWHFFVLVGTVLHFFAILYSCVLN